MCDSTYLFNLGTAVQNRRFLIKNKSKQIGIKASACELWADAVSN